MDMLRFWRNRWRHRKTEPKASSSIAWQPETDTSWIPQTGAGVPLLDPIFSENNPEEGILSEVVDDLFSRLTMHSYSALDEDRLYEYRPLGTTSTLRLIELMRYKVNDCIACKIHTYDIQQRPDIKYEALSYVWGDPKHTRKVYLSDDDNKQWSPYHLHENLWLVLNNKWQKKMFGRLFWTDYLCLDQNSGDEIAQQIPRMGSIYSDAEQVVAWLELSEHTQDRLLQYLEEFPDEFKDPEGYYHFRKTVLDLARNVYWRRVWIVQEVALAKKVLVTSSNISIDFDELRSKLKRQWMIPSPSMWEVSDLRDAGGKVPLWQLLSRFRSYNSSRPADQVYGLLGIVSDNDDGTSPAKNLYIDYDRPIDHIWLDVRFESMSTMTATQVISTRNISQETSPIEDLINYIEDSRTPRRYRELASITHEVTVNLLVLESILWQADLLYHLSFQYAFEGISRPEMYSGFKPTIQQSAALYGFVFYSKKRLTIVPGPSGWQCAAHRHAQEEPRGVVMIRVVRMMHARLYNEDGQFECVADKIEILKKQTLSLLLKICEKHSESCDGSVIVFEMPHIGFRMFVETIDYFDYSLARIIVLLNSKIGSPP